MVTQFFISFERKDSPIFVWLLGIQGLCEFQGDSTKKINIFEKVYFRLLEYSAKIPDLSKQGFSFSTSGS